MADEWTYPLTNWSNGVQVHENLPIIVDSFDDGLGVANGVLIGSLPIANLDQVNANDVLAPWRRIIWPCFNGQPYGAYVMMTKPTFSPTDTVIQFQAVRVDEIWNHRHIWSTLSFTNVDQLKIARALMTYGKGLIPLDVDNTYLVNITPLPGAALMPWFRLDNSLSDVLRTRQDNSDGYQAATDHTVGEALTKLSEVIDGFEYRLDYGKDSSTGDYFVTARLGYPQLGRTDPVMPFQYPGNITTWQFGETGLDALTMCRVYTNAQGTERSWSDNATNGQLHTEGWPLLMGSDTSNSLDLARMNEEAQSMLRSYAGTNSTFSIELDETVLGSYQFGDNVSQIIEFPYWPTAQQETVRIIGHKIYPSAPGESTRVVPIVEGV